MDDADWEINKCICKTYLPYVKLDTENTQNGILYIYSFKGRLLCKCENYPVEKYNLERKIEGVLETPNLFLPYAGTKSEIRNGDGLIDIELLVDRNWNGKFVENFNYLFRLKKEKIQTYLSVFRRDKMIEKVLEKESSMKTK